MASTIKEIRQNAETIIGGIVLPSDAILPAIEFRKAPRGMDLALISPEESPAEACRIFKVQGGPPIGPGWSANDRREVDQELHVFVRWLRLEAADDTELFDMAFDDMALIEKALLECPFDDVWTAASFVSIDPLGSVISQGDDLWIADMVFSVRYERSP